MRFRRRGKFRLMFNAIISQGTLEHQSLGVPFDKGEIWGKLILKGPWKTCAVHPFKRQEN